MFMQTSQKSPKAQNRLLNVPIAERLKEFPHLHLFLDMIRFYETNHMLDPDLESLPSTRIPNFTNNRPGQTT